MNRPAAPIPLQASRVERQALSRRSLCNGALAATLVAQAASAHAAEGEKAATPVTAQTLQDQLFKATQAGLPGVSAAIATRRGIVWTGRAGLADVKAGKPVTADHIFGVGSITKVFVAVVVLQLVSEGRLSLDATPQALLGAEAMRGIANAAQATVGQLLAHTSGVPSWEDDPAWIRHGRGADLDPAHLWGKTEALDYIRGHPPLCAPGAAFHYSNSGYTLLGLIIERVTGRTAAGEIRRRVLQPLKLRDTYLEGFEPGLRARTPRRHHYATATFRETAGVAPAFPEVRPGLIDVSPSNLSVEWTAGALVTSPRDLATFAIALRDGRLLDKTFLAVMQAWAPARPTADMGHGLFRFKHPTGRLRGHNGSVLGFTGCFWWAETGDVAVAVLANVGTMHAGTTPPAAFDVGLLSEFPALAQRFAAEHAAGAA